INEISKNVDGYRISTFLYKERESEGGEIVAGPLWDFNLAWGNADYCEGGLTNGWEIYFNSVCGGGGGLQNPFWWDRLLQDPEYAHMTNCRWQELRQDILHTDSLMQYIDEMALYLDEAQVRNYIKWPVLGVYLWPNNFIGATYAEEIQYLKDWTTNRVNWMDLNMFGSCPDLNVDQQQSQQLQVFPNPSADQIKITMPITDENANLILYSQDGKLVKEISVQNQLEIMLDVSDLQNGIYLLQLYDEKKMHEPIRFIKL
ncbi:MAG: CotH kinase family protein, partial [Crocinitomicaceae bacterium]|nr:CotH kinase family protein [Crocinitomicaceae bacterium]